MFIADSLNFVPGSRPEWFAKARAAGAGLTVIDLEDAVPAEGKAAACEAALNAVRDDAGFALRINGVRTQAGTDDLRSLAASDALPAALLVPMVEQASELATARDTLGSDCPPLIPLIETPRGLRHALDIASAEGVQAVMFGGGDFSGELGVELAWEPLLTARQLLILACAEARVPAIDVPYIHLDNEQGLREECERAKAIGFACKAAIHPRQVATINAVFAPSDADVAAAREAIAAFEAAGEKAIRHEGRMLEAPLVKQYRATIARAERNSHA